MMRSDDFEARLARVPRAGPPPEWRAEILASGTRKDGAAIHGHDVAGTSPRPTSWRPRFLAWNWNWNWNWNWAWSGLALGWVAVFGVHFASDQILRPTQSSINQSFWAGAFAPVTRSDGTVWYEQRRLQAQLLAELAGEPARPVEPSVRPNPGLRLGPRGELRRDGFGAYRSQSMAARC